MKNEDFETFWKENRERLLKENKEYRRVSEGYKMNSGADWLLFAIPVVAGILSFDSLPIERELLKWVASAAVTVVCFMACVWLKSLLSGERPLSEIEKEVKEKWKKEMEGAQ